MPSLSTPSSRSIAVVAPTVAAAVAYFSQRIASIIGPRRERDPPMVSLGRGRPERSPDVTRAGLHAAKLRGTLLESNGGSVFEPPFTSSRSPPRGDRARRRARLSRARLRGGRHARY